MGGVDARCIRLYANRMRITVNLPDGLLERAREKLGAKTKTETIVVSLEELIRHRRIEHLKSMMGKADFDIDIDASRRRP
jgi:Bacterial antitoxin of type II TA system, VapB